MICLLLINLIRYRLGILIVRMLKKCGIKSAWLTVPGKDNALSLMNYLEVFL